MRKYVSKWEAISAGTFLLSHLALRILYPTTQTVPLPPNPNSPNNWGDFGSLETRCRQSSNSWTLTIELPEQTTAKQTSLLNNQLLSRFILSSIKNNGVAIKHPNGKDTLYLWLDSNKKIAKYRTETIKQEQAGSVPMKDSIWKPIAPLLVQSLKHLEEGNSPQERLGRIQHRKKEFSKQCAIISCNIFQEQQKSVVKHFFEGKWSENYLIIKDLMDGEEISLQVDEEGYIQSYIDSLSKRQKAFSSNPITSKKWKKVARIFSQSYLELEERNPLPNYYHEHAHLLAELGYALRTCNNLYLGQEETYFFLSAKKNPSSWQITFTLQRGFSFQQKSPPLFFDQSIYIQIKDKQIEGVTWKGGPQCSLFLVEALYPTIKDLLQQAIQKSSTFQLTQLSYYPSLKISTILLGPKLAPKWHLKSLTSRLKANTQLSVSFLNPTTLQKNQAIDAGGPTNGYISRLIGGLIEEESGKCFHRMDGGYVPRWMANRETTEQSTFFFHLGALFAYVRPIKEIKLPYLFSSYFFELFRIALENKLTIEYVQNYLPLSNSYQNNMAQNLLGGNYQEKQQTMQQVVELGCLEEEKERELIEVQNDIQTLNQNHLLEKITPEMAKEADDFLNRKLRIDKDDWEPENKSYEKKGIPQASQQELLYLVNALLAIEIYTLAILEVGILPDFEEAFAKGPHDKTRTSSLLEGWKSSLQEMQKKLQSSQTLKEKELNAYRYYTCNIPLYLERLREEASIKEYENDVDTITCYLYQALKNPRGKIDETLQKKILDTYKKRKRRATELNQIIDQGVDIVKDSSLFEEYSSIIQAINKMKEGFLSIYQGQPHLLEDANSLQQNCQGTFPKGEEVSKTIVIRKNDQSNSVIQAKTNYLKQWLTSEASEREVRQFLFYVQDSDAFDSNQRITIRQGGENTSFSSHTCFRYLDIAPTWNEGYQDQIKTNFIKSLKDAMGDNQAYNAS